MRALILAAGYGTRMQKSAAGTEHEKLVKNFPKPLLPINNKPVVFYIYQMLKKSPDIEEILLVTNNKFYKQFTKWTNSENLPIKIINDGSTSNKSRLGAIKDINLAVKSTAVDDDLLVIAGDTLLDFDILDFINFFQTKKAPVITLHQSDSLEQIKQRNEVKIDDSGRIIGFVEKPANPTSLLYSAPCYIYTKDILMLLDKYILDKHNADAPGMFIEWLHKVTLVYGYDKIKRRFDIGNLETYKETLDNFNI